MRGGQQSNHRVPQMLNRGQTKGMDKMATTGRILLQHMAPYINPYNAIYLLFRLPAVGTLKRYSKDLEYEYRVKTVALGTLKRYSILSLTLYLEWYCAYSILYSGGPH
jgi:hypothetical protein